MLGIVHEMKCKWSALLSVTTSLGGGARSKIYHMPCNGRNTSSFAAKRGVATVHDQSKFSERGNVPLLRWDAPPGANATTALTRGSELGAASTVDQTNPLVVDIKAEPEMIAGQHLIQKNPHIRHPMLDRRVGDKQPVFCSLRPARGFRTTNSEWSSAPTT
jgi:hypothetical protein